MIERYRHEEKYMIDIRELAVLESRISCFMNVDLHADAHRRYQIRSVYFDDVYNTCYYDNMNGTDPRSKYRLRIYDLSDKFISLERKTKRGGMTLKESCAVSYDLCMKMLNGESLSDQYGKNSVLDGWIAERNARGLRPVILCSYTRVPYIYRLGNVRVTFDMYITASRETSGLFLPSISQFSLLPSGQHVLEVKYDDYLPDVIREIIDNSHMLRTNISKFYLGCNVAMGRC